MTMRCETFENKIVILCPDIFPQYSPKRIMFYLHKMGGGINIFFWMLEVAPWVILAMEQHPKHLNAAVAVWRLPFFFFLFVLFLF